MRSVTPFTRVAEHMASDSAFQSRAIRGSGEDNTGGRISGKTSTQAPYSHRMEERGGEEKRGGGQRGREERGGEEERGGGERGREARRGEGEIGGVESGREEDGPLG